MNPADTGTGIHAFSPFPFKISGAPCQVNFLDPGREHSSRALRPVGKPGFACAANITINAGITTDDG